MDHALRTLIDRANGGSEVPVGVHLSLTSGIIVRGALAASAEFGNASRPVLTEQAGAVIAEGGFRSPSDHDRELAGNQWSNRATVQALWDALAEKPGDDTFTVKDVRITRPGAPVIDAPAVRIEARHVAAWWLATTNG